MIDCFIKSNRFVSEISDHTLHEKKNFRLTNICEKETKNHFFVSFCMYPFHGSIIFSELSFKQKRKKAVSFRPQMRILA